jgi:hypothetical protein
MNGHRTTDTVLKHYFQPGREEFRRALHSAIPKLLTNGQMAPSKCGVDGLVDWCLFAAFSPSGNHSG